MAGTLGQKTQNKLGHFEAPLFSVNLELRPCQKKRLSHFD